MILTGWCSLNYSYKKNLFEPFCFGGNLRLKKLISKRLKRTECAFPRLHDIFFCFPWEFFSDSAYQHLYVLSVR